METMNLNPAYSKEEPGYIGVFAGILSDIGEMDFSPWGLKCYNINNPDLKEYVNKNSHKQWFSSNWDTIFAHSKKDYSIEQEFWDADNLYVFVPMSLSKLVSEDEIYDCHQALLVAFPSEVSVRTIHYLQVFDEKVFCTSSSLGYDFSVFGKYTEPYKHYLKIDRSKISEINLFLKLYKERSVLDYIRTALKFYSMAWRVNDTEMSFVALCIALEGVVPGKEQVTFRFKRNLAVLCGETPVQSELIYDNAKRLYDLRSSIVHSEITSKTYKYFEQYYIYVKALTSRMIIEMLLQNIPTIKLLDAQLTTLGFGDRGRVSSSYKSLVPNQDTFEDLYNTALPKM